MIINFNPKFGAGYYGLEQTFSFRYGVYTAPGYGFPEVQQDFIDLNVKLDMVIAKLPVDFIAGSKDNTSLENKHGSGSWKTGKSGGGSVIASPWLPREKDKVIENIEELLSGQEQLRELLQELHDISNAISDSQSEHVENLSGLITAIKVENPGVDLSEIEDMVSDLQVELVDHVSIDQFRSLSNKIVELERYVLRLLDNKDLEEELG